MVGEYIDMGNENALIALAYIKESDNPLQVFCNYVIISLMEARDYTLRYDELQTKIGEISGLKMSPHMLKMCCSILKKEKKISKIPNGAGFKLLDYSFNIKDYQTQKALLQHKETCVVNDMISYVKKYNISWDYDSARKYLTDFLLSEGNAVSIFAGYYIQPIIQKEKKISSKWYVGKYITNLLETKNAFTSHLIDIVNGLMIYIGVYEAQDYRQNYNQKFSGTKFFFDTKLILRLMGYSWKLEIDSAKELVELIKSYNGDICIFEHTIGEIEFALSNAADCIKKKEVILDYEFRASVELNGYNDYDLLLVKNSIRNIIKEKLKIKIQPDIDWGENSTQKYNLDRDSIKKYITEKHPGWKSKAIGNDVDIINYINILRHGNYTIKYGGTKKLPIFITSNTSLVYDIKSYIEEHGKDDKNIANWNVHALPVITDNMLMCRLWVPKSSKLSSVPELTLARNAYAAQQIDLSFFEKLRETASILKKNHDIDLIDVSMITKEKIEEIVIKNIAGEVDNLSEEVLASSADELIKLETLSLKDANRKLEEDNRNKSQCIEQNSKNIIVSASQRFKNKIGVSKLLIYLSEYYWIIGTIVFGILSLLLSLLKGFSTLPYCGIIYAILFILLKVSERTFNKGKFDNFFISKSVNFVWLKYSSMIKNELLDFEKEFEKEILIACIMQDTLLNKYDKYCEIK